MYNYVQQNDIFQDLSTSAEAKSRIGQQESNDVLTKEKKGIPLPETNGSPLKINGWKMTCPFAMAYFQGYVGFRECIGFKLAIYGRMSIHPQAHRTCQFKMLLKLNGCLCTVSLRQYDKRPVLRPYMPS